MNCFNIVQQFKIVEKSLLCDHIEDNFYQVDNYQNLEKLAVKCGYDVPKTDFDVKLGLTEMLEDVTVDPLSSKVVLNSDNTEVDYLECYFLIKEFCDDLAIIDVIDEGKYCEDCYIKKFPKGPKIETIKKVLDDSKEDPCKGLSVSKKIQYILNKYPEKLTSTEIYNKGKPWEAAGKTPKNTIAARASTLYDKGHVKKKGNCYYI